MTAFHCTNRADGASVGVPGFVKGPNQRDHSLPGSSVLPLRTKNSMRGSFPFAAPELEPEAEPGFAAGASGGLHHSMRPHCEKSCASKERDSNEPSASY